MVFRRSRLIGDSRVFLRLVGCWEQQDSIILSNTTSRVPTRKSPRLHIEEDDEVEEVPPPPKVIDLIDLTREPGAIESAANTGTLLAHVTTTATT